MQYAGFWRRFVAMVIDSLIVSGFVWVVAVALSIVGLSVGLGIDVAKVDPETVKPEELQKLAAGTYAFVLLMMGIWIVYFAAFESSARQATPGKMALGIVVAGATGQRIGFGQAAARNAAKFVSSLILYIGFLMAAFTSRKQALHDLLTGCLVLRR